jgi:hypothetical protein
VTRLVIVQLWILLGAGNIIRCNTVENPVRTPGPPATSSDFAESLR